MAVLTALSIAGLGYPAILLANFPYSAPQSIINCICALGVASLVSLVAFVVLGMVYRKQLDQRREECRLLVTKLLESKLGNPPPKPSPEGPAGQESRRQDQFPAGGNAAPTGMESAPQG
jgi:hypothetical protein